MADDLVPLVVQYVGFSFFEPLRRFLAPTDMASTYEVSPFAVC